MSEEDIVKTSKLTLLQMRIISDHLLFSFMDHTRSLKGLTYRMVAENVLVNQSNITYYFGRTPHPPKKIKNNEKIKKILNFLDVDKKYERLGEEWFIVLVDEFSNSWFGKEVLKRLDFEQAVQIFTTSYFKHDFNITKTRETLRRRAGL